MPTKRTARGSGDDDPQTQALIEDRQRLAAYDFDELHDRTKRVSVAARKRRKMLESVANGNGVSLEKIDALHEADWALVLSRAEKKRPAVRRVLKSQHARQRAALQTVIKHRERFEYQAGNPVFQTCMWRAVAPAATALLPFTFNQGTAGFAPPAAVFPPPTTGNSIAQFTLSARANATGSIQGGITPVAGLEFLTSHVFSTTARADGILSVTAHYAPLGDVFLGAPGDCVGFGGSAGFVLTLLMDVRIRPQNDAFFINIPRGDVREIYNVSIDAGCDAETRSVLVGTSGGDSYQLTNADLGGVEAGDEIRVNARYVIRLSTALRGTAIADFSGAPAGLNVPLVVAKITT